MADGLRKIGQIRLHQALHGYSDGHRLLASSVRMSTKDAKTMLVMSDASGPGARIGENGYLTGYPLVESGLYGLARTWAAPEMPRPGCVWTHSLLIDFSDLATLPDLSILDPAFCRPEPEDNVQIKYGVPIEFDIQSDQQTLVADEGLGSFLRSLLWGLYGHPRDPVVAPRQLSYDSDLWVLAIWSQQWPRLRRAFRFCTASFSDRSTKSAPFDLQLFLASERAVRSSLPPAVEAVPSASLERLDWLEDALCDLVDRQKGDLWRFLRSAGGDVAGGRDAFKPLCRLYRLVKKLSSEIAAIEEARIILEGPLAPPQARVLRARVANEAARRVSLLGGSALDFVLRNIDLLDPEVLELHAGQIGRAVWIRKPQDIRELFLAGDAGQMYAGGAMEELSIAELVEGLSLAPELLNLVLEHRPDVVTAPRFWALENSASREAYSAAAADQGRLKAALAAMIESGSSNLAAEIQPIAGSDLLLEVVAETLGKRKVEEVSGDDSPWLSLLVEDGEAIARALVSGLFKTRKVLVAVARLTHPDSVPNGYGDDPWLLGLLGAEDDASEIGSYYLSAYLLCRALGKSTRSPGQLAKLTFDLLYSAAAKSRLPEEAWNLVAQRLPNASLWFEWDRCQRLRAALVDSFVERNLPPVIFAEVTEDERRFMQLVELAAGRKQGRVYLERVMRALRERDDTRSAARLMTIKKLL